MKIALKPALYAVFAKERESFARKYPRVRHVCLLVSSNERCISPGKCAFRDLAYQMDTEHGPVVVMHARVLEMPLHNVLGLIRHELGHAADRRADAPGREQRADDIAERVTGQKIRYDRNDVQTIGPGTYPRPKHLHR